MQGGTLWLTPIAAHTQCQLQLLEIRTHRQANQLSDGKLQCAIELGEARNNAVLDGPAQRLHILVSPPLPARLYGYDLPLRTPANLQKNPVWEYKAGVLELKKAVR